jgi:hypothetical protein
MRFGKRPGIGGKRLAGKNGYRADGFALLYNMENLFFAVGREFVNIDATGGN